jgi:hypothetical protein
MSNKGDSTHFHPQIAQGAIAQPSTFRVRYRVRVSDQRERRLADLPGTRFEGVIRVESFLLEVSSGVSSPRNAIT